MHNVFDEIKLMGILFSWAQGQPPSESRNPNPNAFPLIVRAIEDGARSEGLFGAAASAVQAIGFDHLLFPGHAHANAAVSALVVEYILKQSGVVFSPSMMEPKALKDVFAPPTRPPTAELMDRIRKVSIAFPGRLPGLTNTFGTGLSAQIACSFSGLTQEKKDLNGLLAGRCDEAMRAAGFTVYPPVMHDESRLGDTNCEHDRNASVLVVLGRWPSWRGGRQVARAHGRNALVLALIPKGSQPSCLFLDPREGRTELVEYVADDDVPDTLIENLSNFEEFLRSFELRVMNRAETNRELFLETLGAVRRTTHWSRTSHISAHKASRVVGNVESFGASTLDEINDVRLHVGLSPVGGDRYTTLRGVLSAEHKDEIDAFVDQHRIGFDEELKLMDFIARDLCESTIGRNRSRRYQSAQDLMHALESIRRAS
jgi:hypothetical protein